MHFKIDFSSESVGCGLRMRPRVEVDCVLNLGGGERCNISNLDISRLGGKINLKTMFKILALAEINER